MLLTIKKFSNLLLLKNNNLLLIKNYSNITVENRDKLMIIKLNRPKQMNAVNTDTATELRKAFKEFDKDNNKHVAILTGSSTTFCAGFDLKFLASNSNSNNNLESDITDKLKMLNDYEGPGPMGPTRMLLTKPVISAIEGYCVAGGLELSLFTDIRIGSKSSKYGVLCRRFGVPLIDGGTVRLPRIIGHGRAMDLILTGRLVDANEAYNIGLINRLVEDGNALNEAIKYAEEIIKFPQICMRTDRMSAYKQWDLSLEEALKYEGKHGNEPLKTEAIPGALRFLNGSRT